MSKNNPQKISELDRLILNLINALNKNPDGGRPSDEFMKEFKKIVSLSVSQNTVGVSEDESIFIQILKSLDEESVQVEI